MLYPIPHDIAFDAYRSYVYSYRRQLEAALAEAELAGEREEIERLRLAKQITAGYDDEVNKTEETYDAGGWLAL